MKKFITILGTILFAIFVVRAFTYFATGSVSQKEYAQQLVEEQLDANPEIDKYKILEVIPYGEKNFINATVMGLPQDHATQLEIEVRVKETTVKGLEYEQSYYHVFFKLEGEEEWKYGRKISTGTTSGTQQYELEDY
ncbi:hypothetical protein [Radiobacillus deserti]|uniref:Uncharacterized protein n=1 Tax=Radiobacillus deserti TaxID=2594883 RepID=A0A516KD93_9BACI|nr:hypothetical protein [Radiobacillus deserti]QDP39369.1 hypothetical protein FN924_03690 [Radiobacillus deserti]